MDGGEERDVNGRGGTSREGRGGAGMIVVTGATGNAGSQVVRALAGRGERVRAFVRDPGRARQVLGEDAELAVGDFADAASVRAALEGADALLLSCADDPRRVGWETAAIDAAVAAGVRRIVKLSAAAAEPGSPVAFWDWHGQVEQLPPVVRNRLGDPAGQLVHVEPARRRVRGGGRGPAVRARGAGADRDDRPPRRGGGRRGGALQPRSWGQPQAMRGKPTSSPDPARSPTTRWPPGCPRRRGAGWSSSMSLATRLTRP